MIRDEVKAGWLEFSEKFEGNLRYFYLDVAGLVTIGRGQLVDGELKTRAFRLDWRNPDGSAASRLSVASAWWAVKAAQSMKAGGGVAYGTLPGNEIRATEESLRTDLWQRLDEFATEMLKVFPRWDSWPWKAQLATLSMCWAMGQYFWEKYPHFTANARLENWAACAVECGISEKGNAPIHPRNVRNRELFEECAKSTRDTVPEE